MKQAHLIGTCIVAGVLILVTTIGQGYYTERWRDVNDDAELDDMAQRLTHVPLAFGEWEGQIVPDTENSTDQYRKAHVKGHVDLSYHNSRTNKVVRVTLVCGHRKHVAKHTPDQCMVGAGFDMITEPQPLRVSTSDGMAEAKTAQFIRPSDQGAANQRMIWTWARDDVFWQGPSNDRVALATHNTWYKLYVTTTVPGIKKTDDSEDAQNFMKDFLPVLDKTLAINSDPDKS
jgi:hypothetical protein